MRVVKPGGALPEASFAPVPVAEAIAQAQESLGEPIVDAGLTADQARQLSECSDRVDKARKVYEDKREAAKTAKETLENAREELERKVKAFTHPAALPLFDGPQAEADRAKMVEAPEVHVGPEVTDDDLERVDAKHDAEDAEDGVPADQVPF
jgi:hypothetical protein